MAKIVKKVHKKRRLKIEGLAVLLFSTAICGVLFTSLFVRAQKNSLIIQIEDIQAECTSLKEANHQLDIQIQNLVSKDRIYEIAANNGLSQNENNVINVDGDK